MNLLPIFLTGLTTGGLTCLAVQGGLLAGVIANQKKGQELPNKSSRISRTDWIPVGLFLWAKLGVYTLLGLLLGWLGSYFILSAETRVWFQLFSALYMIALALNLLEVHPIFRHVIIRPPRSLERKIAKTSKTNNWFTPILLGLFTVFIPCGVTQAMMIVAMNSGSAIQGMLVMGIFTLGTMPLFAGIGLVASTLSDLWNRRFQIFSAGLLLLMAMYTINGVLVVLNAPVSAQKLLGLTTTAQPGEDTTSKAVTARPGEVQLVNVNVSSAGYSPDYVKVQQGVPVKFMLDSRESYSCANAFVFREFGISTVMQPNDTKTFTFTPNKKGRFVFTCSMGMYTGTMEVI